MQQTANTPAQAESSVRKIVPQKLAHVVIRTGRFVEMLEWYRTVFYAKTSYENPVIAFLTYDDEHHRIALLNMSQLKAPDQEYTGIDHVAFTYGSLQDLLVTYERLKSVGIAPFWCINHGPTTSMYYRDPDSNELEMQVDNYGDIHAATAYFYSDAFAANPIGVDFDPDVLLTKLRAGVPVPDLLRQGAAPVPAGSEYVYIKLPKPPAS